MTFEFANLHIRNNLMSYKLKIQTNLKTISIYKFLNFTKKLVGCNHKIKQELKFYIKCIGNHFQILNQLTQLFKYLKSALYGPLQNSVLSPWRMIFRGPRIIMENNTEIADLVKQ